LSGHGHQCSDDAEGDIGMVTTPTAAPSSSSATIGTAANANAASQLAGNFDEFLKLLTTQLQHQDPLSPLDPNQFTQELVQFSSVEQQIQTNTSLSTLISLQQNAQVTSALGFIGHSVVISGTTAQLTNGKATWNYSITKPATATINISDSTGKTVYSTTQGVSPGQQTFTWTGQTSNGNVLSSGSYKISITATDANGQSVAVATQAQGVVTGVDVSQTPPALTVNGQSYPLTEIQQIVN
jgi:flagellar basal-body rod modification protein FlgD